MIAALDRKPLIFCLRWAAKEAIIKACPRRLTFHDIIIAIRPDQKPYGIVLDHTSERKRLSDDLSLRRRRYLQNQLKNQANGSLEDLSGQIVPLSISHDGEYATAIALYPEESTFDDLGGANTRTNLQRSFFISLDKSLDNYATYPPWRRVLQKESKPNQKQEEDAPKGGQHGTN